MKLDSKMRLKGKFKIRSFKAGTKELLYESPWIPNLVVESSGYGVNILLRQLVGDTTYQLEIDSAKIGTGTNTPADSDTDLQTTVLSGISVSDYEIGMGQVSIFFFITDGELANGTYKEFGLFANSRLFARALITPNYVKTSNRDTTVEYLIEVAN